jgi:hypothetical protein
VTPYRRGLESLPADRRERRLGDQSAVDRVSAGLPPSSSSGAAFVYARAARRDDQADGSWWRPSNAANAAVEIVQFEHAALQAQEPNRR